MQDPPGLGHRVAVGATWVVSQRMAVRAIGLLSTIVLARLLAPADFGLIALATTLAALLDTLTELGFELALIQNRTATRQHYDTAWTLTVLRGLVVATVLLLCAQPMAAIYGDPRLFEVLAWLAFGTFVSGLQNIGIVDFRKELRFAAEFRMLVWSKLGSFVVTLALAWFWRDYHALLAGILAGKLIALAMSYAMHPYRPRLGFAGAGGFLHFSKWLAVNNVIGGVRGRLDTFVVGKHAGGEALGIYSIAYEISNLALSELVVPISRAVHPGFAKMAGDRERLARSFLDLFGVVALLAIPMAVGIALTADHIVRVFLGWKWLDAVPLIQILTLYGLINLPSANSGALYLALGRADLLALRNLPAMLVLVPTLLVATNLYGPQGAAWALVIGAIVHFTVTFALLHRELGIHIGTVLQRAWRPATAACVMGAVLLAVAQYWPVERSLPWLLAQFALHIAAGGATYVIALLAIWRSIGCPAGAEQHAIAALRGMRRAVSPPQG